MSTKIQLFEMTRPEVEVALAAELNCTYTSFQEGELRNSKW